MTGRVDRLRVDLWFANNLSKPKVKPFNDIRGRVVFRKYLAVW
jgi:hypothetical protein